MKHYTDSILLKTVNIISEFALAFITYAICIYVRMHLSASFLKPFGITKFWLYLPFAIFMAIYFVVAYLFIGEYKTLHYQSFSWEFRRILFVHFLGAVFGSSFVYWVKNSQLSRGLLILYIIVSVFIFTVKRVLCHRIANHHLNKMKGNYKVLIIGSGRSVIKYSKELILGKEPRYEYFGYVNDFKIPEMSNYLGTMEELESIIEHNSCDQVVISEEGINNEKLDMIMDICNRCNISVQLAPTFSEYYDIRQNVIKTREGTKLVPLSTKRCSNILGVNIVITNIDEVMDRISENLDKWRGEYICISNVHTTVMSYENPDYCRIQNEAVMALPDGGPLSSYSRSRGVKDAERVTGPDLMREILKYSKENGWKNFFYGSSEETLTKLKEVIEDKYEGANVCGMISPPYRALTEEEDAEYIRTINEAKPDFVWVGLGAPKQEEWMAAHKGKINAIMIGVGAAFDYESGNIKRAPKWMQKCSLEWLYRLMQDPKRLFKRYFVTNIKYMWLTRK